MNIKKIMLIIMVTIMVTIMQFSATYRTEEIEERVVSGLFFYPPQKENRPPQALILSYYKTFKFEVDVESGRLVEIKES